MLRFLYRMAWLCLLLSYAFSDESVTDNSSTQKDSPILTTQLDTVFSAITPAYETLPDFSTATVMVLDKHSFSASDVNAADVLELLPGVQLQHSGEVGSRTTLTVRGAPSQQTKIYIDNMLQPNVSGEGAGLDRVLLSNVERIELYPSNSPNQFAQGSPAGAINIVMRNEQTNFVRALVEVGSFDYQRLATSGSWNRRNLSLSATLENERAENDFPYLWDNGTAEVADDDSWQTRNNAQFQAVTGQINGSLDGDGYRLEASVLAEENRKSLPHPHNHIDTDAYYAQQHHSLLLGAHVNQWLGTLDSSLRYNVQQKTGLFSDPNSRFGFRASHSQDHLVSHQLQHTSVSVYDNAIFTLNNSAHVDKFSIDDSLAGTKIDARRQQLYNSVGAEVFLTDAVTGSLNLRLNAIDDLSVQQKDTEQWFDGGAGLRLDLSQQVLQLNAQAARRVPNLIERFGAKGDFVGNDELLSESSVSADLSYQYTGQWITTQINAFARRSEHAIVAVYNSQGVGRFVNLDTANFAGVEWQLGMRLPHFALHSSGTLQHGISRSALSAFDNRQPPGFYPISTRQKLSWQLHSTLDAQLEYLFEQGLYFDRSNSTQAQAKHSVNTEVNWTYRSTSVGIHVNNLLNQYQMDFSRKYLPGRSITLTFEYLLGART